MDTYNLETKIDGLRNQTIQNGCTREEAHTARMLLSKLQTKLNLARQAQAVASYVARIHYTPTEADQILQEIRKQAREKAQYAARPQTPGPESEPGSPAIRNWAAPRILWRQKTPLPPLWLTAFFLPILESLINNRGIGW